MDIAAFVGIAACGPLHTPVAVEDAAQFEAVFGGDAALAWEPASGQPAAAYLAPAVRAFFLNGGKRCWIVRVAGDAQYARFDVPGIVQLGASALEPAVLRARSEGSWADTLRVATSLESTTLAVAGSDGTKITFAVSRPDELAPADLIRITTAAGTWLLAVATAEDAPPPLSPPPDERRAFVAVEPVAGTVFFMPSAR